MSEQGKKTTARIGELAFYLGPTATGVGVLLLLVGLAWLPSERTAFAIAFLVATASWIVVAPGVLFLMRGDRHTALEKLASAIFLYLGLSLSSSGALLIVNGPFDDHEPEAHRVQLVDKTRSRPQSGGGNKYYWHIRDWRNSENSLKLRLGPDFDTWEAASEGDEISIIVKPGRLGWPRIMEYHSTP
ncbi:MAG: hypothetical protein HN348_20395 [Proteobacteria bacterium]|jgi:hypothetical protein|nr:hypothetical protein [Pseudomonadota bacterium]